MLTTENNNAPPDAPSPVVTTGVDPQQLGRRKSGWRGILVVVFQAAAGGAFGFLATAALLKGGLQLAPPGTSKAWALLTFAVALALAVPVQTMVHELGHALAGRLMGGFLLRFVVGPWRCLRFRSGFRWQRVRSLKGIGGFVQTLMPADAQFRRAMTVMLLGGPLANLLLAGVYWLVMAYAPYWPLRVSAVGLVLFGVFLGLINLVPFRVRGFMTDGAQLLRLWTKPDALMHAQRMARIARSSVDGLRPRELQADDLAALDPSRLTGIERFAALALRAAVAADGGDLAQARRWLEPALADWDQWPDGFRQVLAIPAAELSIVLDGDAAAARAWLAKAEGGLIEDFHVAWVEAGIAGLEERAADRAQALERVRRGIEDTVYRGDEQIYRERLALGQTSQQPDGH